MDENQVVNEEIVDTQVDTQAVEFESEARESGWVPKEEFSGDPKTWVDAAEFVRRGPLFKKIDTQSREIKAMRKAIEDIQALHEKSREVEYKRALADLRAEKKAALLDGDADAVIEVDEKMEMVREAQREQQLKPIENVSDEPHPEFQSWVNRNQWYQSHKGMKAFADAVGTELRAQGLSPADVLRQVEKEVRKEFPSRFQNPNQNKPSGVEGGTGLKGGGGKDSFQLTDDERTVMRNLVRLGTMTEKAYIDEIKKIRGA